MVFVSIGDYVDRNVLILRKVDFFGRIINATAVSHSIGSLRSLLYPLHVQFGVTFAASFNACCCPYRVRKFTGTAEQIDPGACPRPGGIALQVQRSARFM